MSAPKSRRTKGEKWSPAAALIKLEHAMADLEGSAFLASEAVSSIGYHAVEKERARYTADRLLQEDVAKLRLALNTMHDALQAGAA